MIDHLPEILELSRWLVDKAVYKKKANAKRQKSF